jgi:hypothetical protein
MAGARVITDTEAASTDGMPNSRARDHKISWMIVTCFALSVNATRLLRRLVAVVGGGSRTRLR